MIERLDQFMAQTNRAYYATHDPFSDFTTAPEISQVFGELIGLWCHMVLQTMGAPDRFALIEAGPGRGTLMSDALRVLEKLAPDTLCRSELHFLETSPRLSAILRTRFPQAVIHWNAISLPEIPMLLIGNEFLDVLPIRQFVRRASGWAERYVSKDRWHEELIDEASLPGPDVINIQLKDASLGSILEFSEAAHSFTSFVSRRLVQQVGAAIFFDYGPTQSGFGETLQAIRHGKPTNPLLDPGSADLTAHVDFDSLSKTARHFGCSVAGPIPQGAFLSAMGIHERTAQLGRHATVHATQKLIAATRRLTATEAMGGLFKAFAITSPTLGQIPGFPG